MKRKYHDKMTELFPQFAGLSDRITVKEIQSGSTLLSQGNIATKLFVIIEGCVRAFYIKENGVEVTSQFFIEGQMIASLESATTGAPSQLNIETIEDSVIGFIQWKIIEKTLHESSLARDSFGNFLMKRLIYYMNQQSSFILDNPEKRYMKFIEEQPELASRLPKQYIASYLGITPVSLSRIRSRLRNRLNNC
ncbi:MAG TPA: Crp/Fnr family transcriptional regulator [Syntrophorhabdaceae bacterium]|nr:Crp/Fnr family transcriptional regulator [Syntrophorhabdaceae bacterium]